MQPCEIGRLASAEAEHDAAHLKAWKSWTKQQAELRAQIERLVAEDLAQREPTVEDVEEGCTTAQIMSLCASPTGWMHIEQALATWLDPIRKAAEERAAEALLATAERQPARPSALVTAAELARRETAKLASSAPTRERLVRSAGNRKADWAAITRVEYDDKGAAEEELWEEELRLARNGELFLASERERATWQSTWTATWTAAWTPGNVSERRTGRAKDEPCASRGLEEEGPPMPVSRADDLAYPDDETRERLLEHDDLWQLDTVEREQLAWLWLHSKFGTMYERLAGLCEQYERACREKLQLQQQMHLRVLRRARLVGMTRSAFTQYAPLVAALECQVVVVDDAAEALESHTLIAITPSLTHLILCGDRQQVHPRSSVARLARTFRLPTSMFERLLVLRDKSHAAADMGGRLTLQHRLPAALSRLLRPLYPLAEAVGGATAAGPSSKGGVKGVERAVYMLKHTKPESVEASSRSRCNVHEAKFCAAFALYLMRQGYAPRQMTVLAPYCGQLLTVQRELRALGVPGLEQVVTSLIDAYHGEENDIVLLSLVRSPPAALAGAVPGVEKPPQGALGLVGSEPRMGAALSRARLGLYVIGNAEALAADSKLWEVLLRYLNEGGAVGAFLPLQATRTETGKRALVRSGDDFDGVVGEWEQRLAEQHASAEKTVGSVV